MAEVSLWDLTTAGTGQDRNLSQQSSTGEQSQGANTPEEEAVVGISTYTGFS